MCILFRSFNGFLQQAASGKEDYPKTLDDLSKAGIQLVIADSNDPDSVGYVQWRVSFYVAGEDGSVLNFMSLFGDYLVWKAKAMAKDIEVFVCVSFFLIRYRGGSGGSRGLYAFEIQASKTTLS